VRDARLQRLDEPSALIFMPADADLRPMLVRAKGAADRAKLLAVLQRIAPRAEVAAIEDLARESLDDARAGSRMALAIGLVALLLSTIGVLGTFWFNVEERRREIGIRLALGARGREVVRAVARSVLPSTFAGLAAGLLLGAGAGSVLRAYLFGVSPLDPISFGAVIALILACGALASLAPLRRAMRVDPAVTLRAE
jgi:ABC-type antimicrobial peptide transport system permease subunit